jgi:hypothetical protein
MQDQSTSHPATPQHAAVLTTTEARQGVTPGRLRYVLACSMALAVIGMVVAYIVI